MQTVLDDIAQAAFMDSSAKEMRYLFEWTHSIGMVPHAPRPKARRL